MRAGTPADVDAVLNLWRAAVLARDGENSDLAGLEAQILRIKAKFDGKISVFLLAEDSAEITGFILALPHDAEDSGSHLALIGTHPRAQGQGVAKALLIELARNRREVGETFLDLRVLPENFAARRLYESLGWLPSGEPVPHEITGVPFQWYSLELTA